MESAKELLCDRGFESRQPSKILRRPMELSEDEDPVLQDKTTPKPRKRVRCPYEFPTITSEGKPCAQPSGSIQNFEGHQRNHRICKYLVFLFCGAVEARIANIRKAARNNSPLM
ncbi:uncharacterized protein LOC121412763 [Lytechinus variegatus]|uniref:uncharacterized protein LOC121412763 n=1 Tax=Lytechinus variegatus TaxID=7654 RepID=UPI001BB1C361|nr:uncharacterized protein LOC121412763 [Lytechinus variegatus]